MLPFRWAQKAEDNAGRSKSARHEATAVRFQKQKSSKSFSSSVSHRHQCTTRVRLKQRECGKIRRRDCRTPPPPKSKEKML